MEYINSLENNTVKKIKKLKQRKYREIEKKFLAEGRKFLDFDYEPELIILKEDYNSEEELKKIEKFECRKLIVSEKVFNELTSQENSQGVILVYSYCPSDLEKIENNILVLDKVQDPGNLGTIIRTAHAAGVNGIILTKGTVDIYNDKTIRSTMGSIFYVPIIYDNDLSFLMNLKSEGFSLVATSLEESKNFFDEDLSGKVILSVGNEGNGISNEIFDLADKKVKIPMPGGAESLNVGVATSIILFEKVRQRLCKN